MSEVRALVLTGYGLNCDLETAHAFELAGARAIRMHINALIAAPQRLDACQILVFGGGFSWGDDHGAGVLQAVRLKTHMGARIRDFVAAGNLVIGICNGFQTLVNFGLLPGIDGDYQARRVALTYNDCGNFRDAWVHLSVNPDSPCVFTRGLERLELPVRHGEGKFFAGDETLARLASGRQIVLQYARADGRRADGKFPENPNGSVRDIAGICDPTGRVFGLMPHPEAYHHFTNHPDWPRRRQCAPRTRAEASAGEVLGVRLFENAVAYLRARS